MKTSSDYLQDANAVVPRIQATEALAFFDDGETVFLDVRDSSDITASGTVAGAVRINRGFLEFAADDATKFHNPRLQKEARICVLCAAGGQAALAGKTLVEMGYSNIINIGGFGDWQAARGRNRGLNRHGAPGSHLVFSKTPVKGLRAFDIIYQSHAVRR